MTRVNIYIVYIPLFAFVYRGGDIVVQKLIFLREVTISNRYWNVFKEK